MQTALDLFFSAYLWYLFIIMHELFTDVGDNINSLLFKRDEMSTCALVF